MKTIYQLSWEINGETKYATFQEKNFAEQMADSLSKLSRLSRLGEITFEINEVSLYEDAVDFVEALTDHISGKELPPLYSLN